jgi:hypothetical protein
VPDLETLLPLEPGRTDSLDWFIASCLTAGGLWDSPRTSDGIDNNDRVLERGPNVLRVYGRIWDIAQTLHTFWLETARDDERDRFGWFLYFDVAASSARRARNALDNYSNPDDIDWHARLAGEATVRGDALAIVPGATRVLVRESSGPRSPFIKSHRD